MKMSENYRKVVFYETYFEESNINQKLLIWSQDKIITKFGPKKWVRLVLGKVYDNCTKIKEKYNFKKLTSKSIRKLPKIEEKCYFTKLISKIVISTRNYLFGPKIR